MGRPPPCRWRGAATGCTSPRACAFEDWVSDPCTRPLRPIRQLQGRADNHWPRETADTAGLQPQGHRRITAGDAAQPGLHGRRTPGDATARSGRAASWTCTCAGTAGRVDGGSTGVDGPAARIGVRCCMLSNRETTLFGELTRSTTEAPPVADPRASAKDHFHAQQKERPHAPGRVNMRHLTPFPKLNMQHLAPKGRGAGPASGPRPQHPGAGSEPGSSRARHRAGRRCP